MDAPTFEYPADMNKRDVKLLVRHMEKAAKTGQTHCGTCGRLAEVWQLFRCYYCGFWVCDACGPKHFGKTRSEWFAEKETATPTEAEG